MTQKLWGRLIKGQSVRFISHLDLLGTLEKALRRAQVPVAMTQGYNPRPKIAFAAALSVGVTSGGEYVELVLRESRDPGALVAAINSQLPCGLELTIVREVGLQVPALSAVVNVAKYFVTIMVPENMAPEEFQRFWQEFFDQKQVVISRETKKGTRSFDFLPLILGQELEGFEQGQLQALLEIKVGSQGSVRPEEVLTAFWQFMGQPGQIVGIHREGLYVLEEGGAMLTPLDWVR